MHRSSLRGLGQKATRTSSASPFLPSTFFLLTYLLCLPAYCLLRIYQWDEALKLATFIIPCLLCAFAIAHAIERMGLKWAALFFATGALISLGAEALGTATGLLFGHYTYTEQMGGKLFGLVPWLIPIAWCGMLYLSWHTVTFLLQQKGGRGNGAWETVPNALNSSERLPIRPSPFPLISLSALAITAWDLSLDPRMVQDGNWIWHDGGPYFGIPISNFIGWLVTAACIYAVWAWLEHRRSRTTHASHIAGASWHALLPIVAYMLVWLGESVANVLFWAGPLVGLCVFVGMGVFAVPALVRLIKLKRADTLTE